MRSLGSIFPALDFGGPPVVASLSSHLGDTLGGQSVVIVGPGVGAAVGASGVTFGGANAASYTVDSPTQLTAVAPAHAAGSAPLVVTTPAGSSAPAAYEFWNPLVPGNVTLFLEAPQYAVALGVGTFTARSGGSYTGGTPPADSPAGTPHFNGAGQNLINAATWGTLIGLSAAAGCTIAAVIEIDSIASTSSPNVEANEAVINDTSLFAGLLLGGPLSDSAIWYNSDGADRTAQVSLGTAPVSGRRVLVAERDVVTTPGTPFLKITADAAPTWTNGDNTGDIANSAGMQLGFNHFFGGKSYKGRLIALVTVTAGWSDVDTAKFFAWADSRHP